MARFCAETKDYRQQYLYKNSNDHNTGVQAFPSERRASRAEEFCCSGITPETPSRGVVHQLAGQDGWVISLRPHLDRVLIEAVKASPDQTATWLDHPPAGVRHFERSVRMPAATTLATAKDALFSWEIHRRAGLRIAASGSAAVGKTVVLGQRLGPVWAVAPCRVVDVVENEGQVGFTYVALPGHPEAGAERFVFVADEEGIRFEVSAASRHVFWGSRLAPGIAGRVQAAITERYLRAAQGRR